MTSREMQEAVEIELRQFDPTYEVKDKLESKEIFHFLTRAERDFVQDIYDKGLDKNEENRVKLGSLLSTSTITGGDIASSTFYPSSFIITLPSDTLYVTNERASTSSVSDIFVKPISFDEYNVNKNNPFRMPTVEKYLRLKGLNEHIILTPNTTLASLKVDYIKIPLGINVSQDCELNENVHLNIVKSAVKLIKAAKENQVGYQIQHKEEIENK